MLREMASLLFRALLQWALASLLLANGAFFHAIAALAASFRLGPPCVLCARVDSLFLDCGASPRHLLCGAHVAEIARSAVAAAPPEPDERAATSAGPAPALSQRDAQEAKGRSSGHGDVLVVEERLVVDPVAERKAQVEVNYLSNLGGGVETHRVVSIGSEICEQDRGEEEEEARDTDQNNAARIGNTDTDDPYVSLFELAPIVALQLERPGEHPHDQDSTYILEKTSFDGESYGSLSAEMETGERLTIGRLIAVLRAERRELRVLRAELDEERHAKMEALEYQRQLEEQGEFDREAVRIAMQLIHETEKEKHDLQRQLEAYKVKAQLYESEERQNMASIATSSDADIKSSRGDQEGHEAAEELKHENEVEEQAAEGDRREGNGNYQSLVDFLPGSVYSSSPDLANLLKLYTEGSAGVHQRSAFADAHLMIAVEEEVLTVTGSTGNGDNLEVTQADRGDNVDDSLGKGSTGVDITESTLR